GDPGCLDYIWVRGRVTVTDARLVFDRPALEDPTLYPSDHLGISAHVEIGWPMPGPPPSGARLPRLSHRGDWRQATENTIAAFLAAMAIPACDGLELDVRLSADGVPVVIHDETLTRAQGRPLRGHP